MEKILFLSRNSKIRFSRGRYLSYHAFARTSVGGNAGGSVQDRAFAGSVPAQFIPRALLTKFPEIRGAQGSSEARRYPGVYGGGKETRTSGEEAGKEEKKPTP